MSRRRPTLAELLARIEALEARVDRLGSGSDTPRSTTPAEEEIPWMVLAAAVAAVLPDATSIRSIRLLANHRLNWWGIEGRLEHFRSRRLK